MKINVASKNNVKVNAVKEVIKNYWFISNARVISFSVPSDVSEQPKSLEETVNGAINRAKNSFNGCKYSIGIESGLMRVPRTKTGYMDVCTCAVYDGKDYHLGLSCAFEFPIKVTEKIFKEGVDANNAFFMERLTKDKDIGSEKGAIGLLTKGRITRKAYTKQAIQMALIHLENHKIYKVK